MFFLKLPDFATPLSTSALRINIAILKVMIFVAIPGYCRRCKEGIFSAHHLAPILVRRSRDNKTLIVKRFFNNNIIIRESVDSLQVEISFLQNERGI